MFIGRIYWLYVFWLGSRDSIFFKKQRLVYNELEIGRQTKNTEKKLPVTTGIWIIGLYLVEIHSLVNVHSTDYDDKIDKLIKLLNSGLMENRKTFSFNFSFDLQIPTHMLKWICSYMCVNKQYFAILHIQFDFGKYVIFCDVVIHFVVFITFYQN